jgi:hypothetical protein
MASPFTAYASLVEPLPPLVRKQRRLEAKLAAVVQTAIDEKAVRAEIDALLVAAGLQKGDVVTCLGYDIRHNVNAARSTINPETLVVQLVAAGLNQELVAKIVQASTETGSAAVYCTVKPSKGAKVRA